MPLSPEETAMLLTLAAPIDRARQGEFLSAVVQKIEAAPEHGPGSTHRAARETLGGFWTPPADLRQGRLGPRGPRNA